MTTTTKNTVKAPAELQALPKVVAPMADSKIKGIAAIAIKADKDLAASHVKHGESYAECTASLRNGIPSGLTDQANYDEYKKRLDLFVTTVADAYIANYTASDKKEVLGRKIVAIKKSISRYNDKALWKNPKEPKSQTVQAQELRAKVAADKATSRAVAARVKVLQKELPKADEKELIKIAKADVKLETREMREERKASANDARILTQGCEMLAAFSSRIGEQCEVDSKDVQAKIAALVIAIQAITPKA
jgi:Ca2+-dependent lipid-binding protein